ncbi:hypothetical protein CDAR_205451 [Caerostris darwini]|uniref:Uncharacterized protein n=1 Tax=Caerostris darwini TaxID=1538125 RepID=A0AAV4WVE3_9ARAC|nr:hypothetical protein CDAR_205451 [Caerostris darwini]
MRRDHPANPYASKYSVLKSHAQVVTYGDSIIKWSLTVLKPCSAPNLCRNIGQKFQKDHLKEIDICLSVHSSVHLVRCICVPNSQPRFLSRKRFRAFIYNSVYNVLSHQNTSNSPSQAVTLGQELMSSTFHRPIVSCYREIMKSLSWRCDKDDYGCDYQSTLEVREEVQKGVLEIVN